MYRLVLLLLLLLPARLGAQSWDWVMGNNSNSSGFSNVRVAPDGELLILGQDQKLFSTAFQDTVRAGNLGKIGRDGQFKCGTTLKDYDNAWDGYVRSAVEVKDTTYMIIGVNKPFLLGNNTTSTNDCYLGRLDRSCNWIGMKKMPFGNINYINSDNSGDLYIGSMGPEKYTKNTYTYLIPCFSRIDHDGNIIWTKKLDSGARQTLNLLHGHAFDMGGNAYIVTGKNSNFLIKRLSPSGVFVDSVTIQGEFYGYNIFLDREHDLNIIGYSYNDLLVDNHIISTDPDFKSIIIELDKDLHYVDNFQVKKYTKNGSLNSLIPSWNGSKFMTFVRNYQIPGSAFEYGDTSINLPDNWYLLLVKIDSTGKILWTQASTSTDSSSVSIQLACADNCGNLYYGGYVGSASKQGKIGAVSFGDKKIKYNLNGSYGVLAKFNPDSLAAVTETDCEALRLINKAAGKLTNALNGYCRVIVS